MGDQEQQLRELPVQPAPATAASPSRRADEERARAIADTEVRRALER